MSITVFTASRSEKKRRLVEAALGTVPKGFVSKATLPRFTPFRWQLIDALRSRQFIINTFASIELLARYCSTSLSIHHGQNYQ